MLYMFKVQRSRQHIIKQVRGGSMVYLSPAKVKCDGRHDTGFPWGSLVHYFSHLGAPVRPQLLAHSIPWNEAIVPCGYAHVAQGTRPLFRGLYFCCLGKHSQTETGLKTNFLLMKGENSTASYCLVLTFKLVKIQCLVKEKLVF